MSIFAVGSEDSEFVPQGQTSFVTAGAFFRSNYVRGALRVAEVPAGNTTQGWQWDLTPRLLPVSWLTARAYFAVQAGNASRATGAFWSFRANGVERLRLRHVSVGNGPWCYSLSKLDVNGVETVLKDTTNTITTDQLIKLDIELKYAVAGYIRIYADGVLVLSYEGDLTTNGVTELTHFTLAGMANTVSYWSEFIMADEDTRSMALARLAPTADYGTPQWVGGVALINEAVLNDATAITVDTVNKNAYFSVTPAAFLNTANLTIRAISIQARAARGATGPQEIRATCFVTGAVVVQPTQPAELSYKRHGWVIPSNSRTGLPWTMDDLKNSGFALGVRSAT